MKRFYCVMAVVLSLAIGMPAVAAAQAKPAEQIVSAEHVTTAPVTLKVTVVVSRYAGEKKIANLPFVLMVIAGDRDPTTVQMSSQVPFPGSFNAAQGNFSVETKSASMSYSYQNFGTSIRASAKALDGGLFNVSLAISDSQMMSDAAAPDAMKGLAKMQNFSSEPRLLLRDGQTVQYAAATDKITSEVVKVDVTLNVIK